MSRFYGAYSDRDGSAACALLAPGTRRAVVSAADKPCPAGLLEEKLAGTGQPATASVYGDQAMFVIYLAVITAGLAYFFVIGLLDR